MINRVIWAIVVTMCVIVLGIMLSMKPPADIVRLSPNTTPDEIDQQLGRMSLRDQVSSLFILHVASQDPAVITEFMTTIKPGGLILMRDNIPPTSSDLRRLTDAVRGNGRFTPFVAIDQEGGTVRRLDIDTLSGPSELRNLAPEKTAESFRQRSNLLRDAGITLNFGVVADVTSDINSFIYPRVLGTTAESSSERVTAAVNSSRGIVYSTLKHFPGHGETNANSHYTVPSTSVSKHDWQQRDKPPFVAGIKAGAEFVMFGHLRYSSVDPDPASLSKAWHDILEQEIGFRGVSITDDMFMLQDSGEPAYSDPAANAVNAIIAGNTMLLYVTNNGSANKTSIDPNALIDSVVAKVEDGAIPHETIKNNVRKVLLLQLN